MTSYGSIWVKPSNPVFDEAFIQDEYEIDVATLAKNAFICIVSDWREDSSDVLEELSRTFGEAMAIVVQTTVDWFSYGHWQKGQILRELSYTADSGWYLVEGTPEAWEADLFSEEALQQALTHLDPQDQEFKTALQQFWQQQQLVRDQCYPRIAADALYLRLSDYFDLPPL